MPPAAPLPYRAGWIGYTNVSPILDSLVLPPHVSVRTGVPTQINAALLSGEVDFANISAAEFVNNAGTLAALPDFSVSVLGQVYSVNLFHSRPLPELRRIALTAQSATSVALLKLLLREWGLKPELLRAEGEAGELLTSGFDGVLRIGDSALQEWHGLLGPLGEVSMTRLPTQRGGVQVTDLANEWHRLTGSPFVFAVWAYRKGHPPPPELLRALRQARREGLSKLGALAAREGQRLGLPARVVQHYLWNFRYHLEEPDRRGLAQFASHLGVDPEALHFGEG